MDKCHGAGRLNMGFVNCRGWWSREEDFEVSNGFEEVQRVEVSGDSF